MFSPPPPPSQSPQAQSECAMYAKSDINDYGLLALSEAYKDMSDCFVILQGFTVESILELANKYGRVACSVMVNKLYSIDEALMIEGVDDDSISCMKEYEAGTNDTLNYVVGYVDNDKQSYRTYWDIKSMVGFTREKAFDLQTRYNGDMLQIWSNEFDAMTPLQKVSFEHNDVIPTPIPTDLLDYYINLVKTPLDSTYQVLVSSSTADRQSSKITLVVRARSMTTLDDLTFIYNSIAATVTVLAADLVDGVMVLITQYQGYRMVRLDVHLVSTNIFVYDLFVTLPKRQLCWITSVAKGKGYFMSKAGLVDANNNTIEADSIARVFNVVGACLVNMID